MFDAFETPVESSLPEEGLFPNLLEVTSLLVLGRSQLSTRDPPEVPGHDPESLDRLRHQREGTIEQEDSHPPQILHATPSFAEPDRPLLLA